MVEDIAHVLNRGVEGNKIFLDTQDYQRFVDTLFLINNKKGKIRTRSKNIFSSVSGQEKLVDVLKWCLMPNHFHLLLYELVEGGISEFTRRLENSYTKYFNTKNKRKGYLFQNAARIIRLSENSHLDYIPFYIEANPVKLIKSTWKEAGIKNSELKGVTHFLESYQWSSYPCRHAMSTRGQDFSGVVNLERFFELFETSEEQYEKDFTTFLHDPVEE